MKNTFRKRDVNISSRGYDKGKWENMITFFKMKTCFLRRDVIVLTRIWHENNYLVETCGNDLEQNKIRLSGGEMVYKFKRGEQSLALL